MKKNILSAPKLVAILLSLLCCFQCQDLHFSENPQPSSRMLEDGHTTAAAIPPLDMNWIRSKIQTVGHANFYTIDQYIGQYDNNYEYINYERLMRDDGNYWKQQLSMSFINVATVAKSVGADIIKNKPTATNPGQVPNVTTAFDGVQLNILNTYFNHVSGLTSINDAISYGQSTLNSIVNNASLVVERKIPLLAIVETATNFLTDVSLGKHSGVYDDLRVRVTGAPNNPCSINWKNAWRAGVLGGVYGAVRGALAGAAGGTVTFPGLGTATGALAGGVFGFALGFASGAGASIVQDIVFDCLLKSSASQPSGYYSRCASIHSTFNCCNCSNSKQIESQDAKKWYLLN